MSDPAHAGLDNRVRLFVYRFFLDEGRPPVPPEISTALVRPVEDVEASLRRLADAHVLVLAPGTPYVWMANPLSAIPTPFPVEVAGRTWFGNCIWDALGLVAMLGRDGDVRTWCPDCAQPLSVAVRDGSAAGEGILHFAVPARRWWEDIGFT